MTINKTWRNYTILGVVSAVLTATVVLPRLEARSEIRSRQVVEGRNDGGEADRAVELALIFLGSSNCYWCRVKEMPHLLEDITRNLEAQAERQGWGFRAVAVLQSPSSRDGLEYFDRMFFFHEVVLGGGSSNIGMRRYALEDLPGPSATPQIILTARWRDTIDHRRIAAETVLMRKVGLQPIQNWAQRGAPVVLPMAAPDSTLTPR